MLGRRVTRINKNERGCQEGLIIEINSKPDKAELYTVEYDNGQFGRYYAERFAALFAVGGHDDTWLNSEMELSCAKPKPKPKPRPKTDYELKPYVIMGNAIDWLLSIRMRYSANKMKTEQFTRLRDAYKVGGYKK